jgi:chemotaxis protein histidine kinase CheA
VDKQGPWEGVRRYNHFYCLYEALQKRWPGILIPKLPSKKAIGNKEVKFIYERKFYLERFLRKCAKYDFLVNSEEFRVFARPASGDVEKMLDRLPRIPYGTMIERFREVSGIDEMKYDFADKERLSQVVAEFSIFAKKVLVQMKAMKKSLSNFRDVRMQSIANNRVLMTLLDKYEDLNINCYNDSNPEKLVLNNPEQKQLKEQMEHMVDNQKNSFDQMYHWCKGEIYDIKAVVNAIAHRDNFEGMLKKTEKKKANTEADLDNVNAGKKTIRTIFKDEKDSTRMQTTIEVTAKELDNLETLISIITIYLGEKIIPQFKKDKLKIYHKLMQQFTVIEINNAHQTASFWSNVLSNPLVKNAPAKA